MPSCAECRAAENYAVPACALVLVLDDRREDKPRPCRRWVCSEHLEMYNQDGTRYRFQRLAPDLTQTEREVIDRSRRSPCCIRAS